MSIRQTLDVIEQRLLTLQAIPEDNRSEFINGSVTQLLWCREQINVGISALMPAVGDDEDDDDDDDRFGSFEGASSVSLIRSARQSVSQCIPYHDHAYALHSPQRNYKQCKHCHDVQRMVHGEKISYGRRNNRKSAV